MFYLYYFLSIWQVCFAQLLVDTNPQSPNNRRRKLQPVAPAHTCNSRADFWFAEATFSVSGIGCILC